MRINNPNIDAGRAFDFGKTSSDYAKYRDIYPEIFYQKIVDRGLCVKGQRVLDLGTGTGVLPRHMAQYGAEWVGTDLSPEQIAQARRLSEESGLSIRFEAVSAENIDFPDNTFDVVTACQCFWYFDPVKLMPNLSQILKKDGKLLVLYMAWLPFEDRIAGESEKLVLRYSPDWTGAGETKKPIAFPDLVFDYFDLLDHEEYDLAVPFTRESWHGRMRACRGVGASLSPAELANWDKEHKALLEQIAPESFEVRHYAALAVLRLKK